LLLPLILTLSWALFSLTHPRDPNSEGQLKKHLLPFHQRHLPQSFLLYFTFVCTNVEFRPSSICMT
jgi:hypothetical protein